MWGVLAVYRPHGVCPSSWSVLPGSTLLRLQGVLQGHCPKLALHFVHFPGLSHSDSGSLVCHKGTDLAACVLCALLRSEKPRQPGAWRAHCLWWVVHLNHLSGPSHLVSQVCGESTVSGVSCVSSRELISGCDTPDRCQPSRIPGRCG